MHNKQPPKTDSSRRRFIAGLTAVGGLAATQASLSGAAANEQPPTVASEQPPEALGYQNSDHVQAYYRSLKD